MLSLVTFLPLAGALFIALFLHDYKKIRIAAVCFSFAAFIVSIFIFVNYDSSLGGLQFQEEYGRWFPDSFNAQFHLGVDGLSVPLVLLTGLLGLCSILASGHITTRVKEYFIWLLVLQTAVFGVFVSMDLILFFIFWELELVPMYFLIAIWGTGRKEYSAMKFLIFTLAGSASMLAGILVVFFSVGSFSIPALSGLSDQGVALDAAKLILPASFVFVLFFVAFAVKLPIPPLHTWLPDAHTDAPTAVSIMLAGVLIKMGGYGIIRIAVSMFPEVAHEYGWVMAAFATIAVLYGAMVTMRQNDLKRLIAFSSISHMGYVLLGVSTVGSAVVNPIGLTGAGMQMFTHGTITGLLFLLVGIIYDKAHTRYIPHLGGLASKMPIVAIAFIVASLASLGLPGLSGFVSEILIFLGAFPVYAPAAILSAFGIVITAGYILWCVKSVMFGPISKKAEAAEDSTFFEAIPIALLLLSIVAVGVYPSFLTEVFKEGIGTILGRLG